MNNDTDICYEVFQSNINYFQILIGTTMPDQSGPDINGNEWVLHIPQSPSCSLVTYPRHPFRVVSYPFLVYIFSVF